MVYLNFLLVVLLTSMWHVLFKWRSQYIDLPKEKNLFLNVFKTLLDPYILLGYICSFLASIIWIVILKKTPLSVAYPFLSLPIVLVLLFSIFVFGEQPKLFKILGSILIVLGVVIVGMSSHQEK